MGGERCNKDLFFKPIRSPLPPRKKVFAFDVETYHKKTDKGMEQHFLMGSVFSEWGAKVFWNLEDMRDFLISRTTVDSYIFATNLEFDWSQIFLGAAKDFKLIYRFGLIGAIKKIKAQNRHMHSNSWRFLDTMKFLPLSVEKLGKMVGLPKLPTPPTFEKNEDYGLISRIPCNLREKILLEKYNIRDSEITYHAARMLQDFFMQHNTEMKMTIASTGLNCFRRNYMSGAILREPDNIVDMHFLGSFRGGMTTVFQRGMIKQDLFYHDINSSYPFACYNGVDGRGSYPYPGSWKYQDTLDVSDIENYDGICEAEVIVSEDQHIPLLMHKTKNALISPVGRFNGWFTFVELREAMKTGTIIKPGRGIYYTDFFKPFRKMVAKFYALRKKYKAENNPYEQMVKTMLNAGLFGKFGSRYDNMEELIPFSDITFDESGQALDAEGLPVDISICGDTSLARDFVSIKKVGTPFRYSMPILSSYTTAMGRIKLWCAMQKNTQSIIYCDTDSIITTQKNYLPDSKELGAWKLEYRCRGGIFIRPKLYLLETEDEKIITKSKGFGKFIDSKNFIQSANAGQAHISRFMRLKESFRRGERAGTVISLLKKIDCEDIKRKWDNRFRIDQHQISRPHFL